MSRLISDSSGDVLTARLSADEPGLSSHKVLSPESEQVFPLEEASPYGLKSCSPPYGAAHGAEVLSAYDGQEAAAAFLDATRPPGLALSPRIEITPSREHYSHGRDSLQSQTPTLSPRPTLTVPGHDAAPPYREPQCLSPASSNSSASWHSESYSPWASPCVSPSGGHNPADLCPRLQNIHTGSPRASPGTSPRTSLAEDGPGHRSPSPRAGSRSTSPQGKRTYDMYRNPALLPGHRSRSPSPHGAHDDHAGGPAHYAHAGLADAMNGFGGVQPGLMPTKIVKKSNQVFTLYPDAHGDAGCLLSCDQDVKAKAAAAAEPFFVIPPIWSKPLVPSICR